MTTPEQEKTKMSNSQSNDIEELLSNEMILKVHILVLVIFFFVLVSLIRNGLAWPEKIGHRT